jgi:hypothetical protein
MGTLSSVPKEYVMDAAWEMFPVAIFWDIGLPGPEVWSNTPVAALSAATGLGLTYEEDFSSRISYLQLTECAGLLLKL